MRVGTARLLKARSATRTAPDDDVVALFQWMLFTSKNDGIVGMSASKSVVVVVLQQLQFGGVQLERLPTTMSLHYFNECCSPANDWIRQHVGMKISHRCRLAAVKFGGVQRERLPNDEVPRRGRIGTVPPARILSTNINKPEAIVCLISDEVENKPLEDASKRRIAKSNVVWLIITIIIMARFLFNKALRL